MAFDGATFDGVVILAGSIYAMWGWRSHGRVLHDRIAKDDPSLLGYQLTFLLGGAALFVWQLVEFFL